MKALLIICCLYSLANPAHSTLFESTSSTESSTNNHIIAKRLATKSLTEIIVIAMQLQLECQQLGSQEVCEGVRNILSVLEARIASLPESQNDQSVEFVKGLIDGVNDANQASIVKPNIKH